MSLYMIQFDGEQDYVEADDYGHAITLWRVELSRQNDGDDYSEEQPEQVLFLTDKDVIRAARIGEEQPMTNREAK